MPIKFLSAISKQHWLKAMLPVFLLIIVFLLHGFVSDQITNIFSAKAKRVKDIFNVNLGDENAAFASALAKEKSLQIIEPTDYNGYLKYSFFQRQRNHRASLQKTETGIVNNNKNSEEFSVMKPEPMYNVSSVFIGKVKRFAIINNKVIKIGDTLTTQERVIGIEDGKVHLAGPWGARWLFVNY